MSRADWLRCGTENGTQGGLHDNTTNNWYDLTGNNHVMYAPVPSWGDNYALCTNAVDSRFRETADEAAWFKDLVSTGKYTLEVVFQPSTGGNSYALNYYVEGFGLKISSQASSYTRTGTNFLLMTQGTVMNTQKSVWISLGYMDTRCAQVSCNISNGILAMNNYQSAINGTFDVTMTRSGMALGARGTLDSWNASGNIGMKHYRMAMYNRPLSSTELAANYAVDKKRFNLP